MTDLATIQFLWHYMIHADRDMLAAVQTVPDAGYRRDHDISLGSVEKLVDHVIAAQEAWLDRFAGKQLPFPAFQPLSRQEMAARWGRTHDRLSAFLNALTPESLQQTIHGRTRLNTEFTLPLWACMLHLADHSAYHRGQLNTLIKLAGGTPSGVMVTRYALENLT